MGSKFRQIIRIRIFLHDGLNKKYENKLWLLQILMRTYKYCTHVCSGIDVLYLTYYNIEVSSNNKLGAVM